MWFTFVDLEPLYDVTLGKLVLSQTGDCDLGELLGDVADPYVWWYDPAGSRHGDFSPPYLGNNTHEVRGFAGTWTEVGVALGFKLPEIYWRELDPSDFDAPSPPVASVPLLPGSSQHVAVASEESNGDCSGVFSYDITYTPRTYPNL